MKKIEDFVTLFSEQFEEIEPSEIKQDTIFHDLDEWSSIIGMCVIAMIKDEFGVDISSLELRECITVLDVYTLIQKKVEQ